ncbi:MAG: branched-chain-amino-acid transaminase [Planctomycetes bacterium]|nr:branched-chain-amino-acid transaminase [Planctomycetota bacterium]
MKVWINGELVDKSQASVSVYDHGLLYGDGVFEGIRVYNGKIFQCDAHIDRLFASAAAIRLKVPYTKEQIVDAMEQSVSANGIVDGYIRLVITRGVGTLGLNPFKCPSPVVFVIADQIAIYSPEMYENGLDVIIAKTRRISPEMFPPSVKSCNYLNNIMAKIEAIDAGVPEAIMLNAAGQVAEATGDNVFIVSDGVIITPPVEAGILDGITRRVTIKLAKELNIPLIERAIEVDELYNADECFLTGTAAEIIAVRKVNDRVIGEGKAGPITLKLLEAFRNFIRSECGG